MFSDEDLAHSAILASARALTREALVELSSDEELAVKALKLGVKNREEREHNLRLSTSGAMPAVDRYTGVLYDALDAVSLPGAARRWLREHVSIQSALFGLVRAGDGIPAYRLSASSRLPGIAGPLKSVWREAHRGLDWPAFGWVLDLRSKDYAELAPLPAGAGASLAVVQRGADGEVRALNHFNKAAKGDLVRRLALSRPRVTGSSALIRWAQAEGLELFEGPGEGELTLVTELGAPAARPSRLKALG